MGTHLFDLNGKIAMVTGSSRGLGYALARGLGQAGATVILNGVNEERLNEAVTSLQDQGVTCHGYTFDVTDAHAIKQAVTSIESNVGPIDILVNNAGIQVRGELENCSEQDWRKIIDVNLTGVFLVSKAAAAGMIKRQSGKIIHVCSIMSEIARATIVPYTATKGGVKMLVRGMATEWGIYNIQVNGLGPGYYATDMTRLLVEDPAFDAWLKNRTPAHRWGKPEELIGPVVFLASKASDFVNGHILYVDGGLLASV